MHSRYTEHMCDALVSWIDALLWTFKTEATIYSQYKAWKGQDIV